MFTLRTIIAIVLVVASIAIFVFLILPKVKQARKYNKEVEEPKLLRWKASVVEEYPQEYKSIKSSMYKWVYSYLLLMCSVVAAIPAFYIYYNYYDNSVMNVVAVLIMVFCLTYLYTYRQYSQKRIKLYDRILEKSTDQFVEERLKVIKDYEISIKYQMIIIVMIGIAFIII